MDLHAPVALVHDGDAGLFIGKDFDLLDRLIECVPVVRVARHAAHPEHQAFPKGGGNRHFDAE